MQNERIAVGIAEIDAFLAFVIDRSQHANLIINQLEISVSQVAGIADRKRDMPKSEGRPQLCERLRDGRR